MALEGYYDGVIFHRVVPGFLVQTGDKTGTGAGGESFYGEQFEDEIHPRLRFAHRGLVACANNGGKNSNDSQFIITLDRAEELHGKHTLFGRCVGDSIYNVLKIGEKELDGNERPLYPPKIKTIRVTENPFPDIIPRITAAEKRAQQRAREQGQKEREEAARRKGAKKDVKLLSFGADEDVEEEPPTKFKKKTMARPDLVDNPESKSSVLPDFASMGPPPTKTKDVSRTESSEKSVAEKKKTEKEVDITKIREKHAKEQSSKSTSRLTEIEKMEAEIRKMTKRRDGGDSSDEDGRPKKKKRSYLDEELSKYKKNTVKRDRDGKKVKDEKDIIAAMNSFRGRLQGHDEDDEPMEDGEAAEKDAGAGEDGERPAVDPEEAGEEVDNDVGFLAHRLRFPKDSGEESVKAERDYEVIDPRQRGARAKEEERERKRQSGGKKQRR